MDAVNRTVYTFMNLPFRFLLILLSAFLAND